ncbi:MAG: BrnA antitoxin family protein [Comamonadaceae bacterium]|nr:BrnA antitoxin family protein [Comamonadaceae bacterium]
MPETKQAILNVDDAALLASIERGLAQAASGQGRVHTPEAIIERRKRGRPQGSTSANRKEAITLRLPPHTLARWRASGKGWQTRAAALLASHAPDAQ